MAVSIDVPTTEPAEIVAGTTATWKKSIDDFPASAWSLSYALVREGVQITIDATADGDDHLIEIEPATTAAYTSGVYSYQSIVEHLITGEKYLFETGAIEIIPGFAAQTTGYDDRTFAKKMVDLLESLQADLATKRFVTYSIAGRSGSYHSLSDLRADLNYWRSVYASEERRAGRGRSNIIRTKLR